MDKEDIKEYQEENQKIVPLLQEEQIMKYQGISIDKNKNCDTWYTRFRKNGKQYYITARTQKDCYNLLKKKLKENPEEELKPVTLSEWYNQWLELYKLGKREEGTIRT